VAEDAGLGQPAKLLGEPCGIPLRSGGDQPARLGLQFVLQRKEPVRQELIQVIGGQWPRDGRFIVERSGDAGRTVEVEYDKPRHELCHLRTVAFHPLFESRMHRGGQVDRSSQLELRDARGTQNQRDRDGASHDNGDDQDPARAHDGRQSASGVPARPRARSLLARMATAMEATFFDSLKQYVGFTENSAAALRELYPLAARHFAPIVDDFYAAIEAHPGARAAVTGGPAQITRLKQTLIRWLETMLTGPHDEAYFQMRARIGRVHVRINLPQSYMFTAMNRIRIHLLDVLHEGLVERAQDLKRLSTALHQIIDLELAIMLETFREDLAAKNRAAERLATIGEFAASMGHELRNPLGVIESSAYLLEQHVGPAGMANPHVAKHLDRITREVRRSNKTIHDLLELAQNRAPRRVRVLLRPIVESALEAAELPKGVAVSVGVPANLAVSMDPDQLHQVLCNLLGNASEAMNGVGKVWIESDAVADGVRLRVRDDGPGVPTDVRPRIFEALFTTKAKGNGLGLALCRRIMAAHGGTIELESKERTATFLVWIPAVSEEAVTPIARSVACA
jgi:two-component system sensor histidine kinase HydH